MFVNVFVDWIGYRKFSKALRTYVWKISPMSQKLDTSKHKKPCKITVFIGIFFTWNIEKNSKKRLIVSRETLYIYAFLCINIRLKAWAFVVYKQSNCIQIYKYSSTLVYRHTSICVYVYLCTLVYCQHSLHVSAINC